MFLPPILIPTCNSSSPVFLTMCSAYRLNKQGHNIKACRTSFPILNQSVVPCKVLMVASCDPHRGFSVVNEAEVDVFLEVLFFLYDAYNVSNLNSCFSAFSKPSLYIWKFSAHTLVKPNLEHNLASRCNECSHTVV